LQTFLSLRDTGRRGMGCNPTKDKETTVIRVYQSAPAENSFTRT
jgi:hypothetical protein